VPALAELQRAFAASLRDQTLPVPAVVAGGEFGPDARLQVYRNNHRSGLRRALADCYPILFKLVGEGFFAWMTHGYLSAHPSRSGNLHEFGACLPAFLATFEAAAEHPWLVDVARLEWARQEAYHAATHAPMDLDALAAVPAERHEHLLLRLHPACRLVDSRWPVLSIFEANGDDDPAPVDLDAGGERVLVSRPAMQVHMERLAIGSHTLLRALADDIELGEACERALAVQPDIELGSCVQALILQRVLVSFELSP